MTSARSHCWKVVQRLIRPRHPLGAAVDRASEIVGLNQIRCRFDEDTMPDLAPSCPDHQRHGGAGRAGCRGVPGPARPHGNDRRHTAGIGGREGRPHETGASGERRAFHTRSCARAALRESPGFRRPTISMPQCTPERGTHAQRVEEVAGHQRACHHPAVDSTVDVGQHRERVGRGVYASFITRAMAVDIRSHSLASMAS